jgi:CBS domain-containing protein
MQHKPKNMNNEAAGIHIMNKETIRFFSAISPFSFLQEDDLPDLLEDLSIKTFKKNTIVFTQGKSKLDHLYIIKEGSAERYYQKGKQKQLRGLIGEGDLFGGISILLNDSIAVRSLKVIEQTSFYCIPKKQFLEICERYPTFSEYFTDIFGKRMVNRSYAEIIVKNFQPKEEGESPFFNKPVSSIVNLDLIYCASDISIKKAAQIMSKKRCSSIFIEQKNGIYIGIVTDNDLRSRVIAKGYDTSKPVSDIMSSPLKTISQKALVVEALMEMMGSNINHIAVTDENDHVIGVITDHDLLTSQGNSPLFLTREISKAKNINEIINKYKQLPLIIQNQINIGAQAKNVNRLITTISDTILNKLIGFTLKEIGPPPVPFVFMVMGSEGRKEQTLKTDQDNAILYEDVGEKKNDKRIQNYFLQLGESVCDMLDRTGYAYCKGGVMAKNPRWCQPLSVWKGYFANWIHTAEPEALLRASIFFDFRGAYGEQSLIDRLRQSLFESLEGWPGFFRHLAENAIQVKPPIGFFRNFVVESKGEHRDAFDIKSAMVPVVDFARIYALKNRIEATNTLDRLEQLFLEDAITRQSYNELEQGYMYMMQLRIVRQIQKIIDENIEADNYIKPKKLSRLDQTMLKEVFKRLETSQAKLGFDFMGI